MLLFLKLITLLSKSSIMINCEFVSEHKESILSIRLNVVFKYVKTLYYFLIIDKLINKALFFPLSALHFKLPARMCFSVKNRHKCLSPFAFFTARREQLSNKRRQHLCVCVAFIESLCVFVLHRKMKTKQTVLKLVNLGRWSL